MMKKGLLIVFSGPSGVGKGTIRKLFFERPELNLAFSVSMTTRKPRVGEVDGVDYFFVSKEEFEKSIENDEFLEYAEFVGSYYGTPLAYVEKLRNQGKSVLLEIEVQGAQEVKEKVPDALSIFVVPPSFEELERRIRGRRSEPEEIIQQRLAKADRELKTMGNYRYVICNDDSQLAADLTALIIKRHIEMAPEIEETPESV